MTNFKLAAAILCAVFSFFGTAQYTGVYTMAEAEAAEMSVAAEYKQTEETAQEFVIPLPVARSFYADDMHVKPLGRSIFEDGIRKFSYTCSGIEFEFIGAQADIDFFCDATSRIGIYLNNELIIDTILEEGSTNLNIFYSNISLKRRITVRKLSGVSSGYVGIKSINVFSENDIKPTPEKERRIEFIGDSITCGYGIDTQNESYGFSEATENGSKTYAALVSERLGAEYSICAWGGIGVYSSYTESQNPNQNVLIGNIYSRLGISDKIWDHSLQQPDLVVINIGTNDSIWARNIEERENKFGEAYYRLIQQVRTANPSAYIICTAGVMDTGLIDEIREQAELFHYNTGDSKIFCFEFEHQNAVRDGYGTAYHPSARTHEIMADSLAKFISEITGWK